MSIDCTGRCIACLSAVSSTLGCTNPACPGRVFDAPPFEVSPPPDLAARVAEAERAIASEISSASSASYTAEDEETIVREDRRREVLERALATIRDLAARVRGGR